MDTITMIKQWFTDVLQMEQLKQGAIALAGVLVLAGGLYYYRISSIHKEQTAHRAFEQCYDEYQKAVEKKSDEFLFEVEKVCDLGYEQNKSTHMGPYFLAVQADALAREGKMDQAIEKMEDVIKDMPSDSQLYWLYKTKLGLFKLDSDDQAINQAGLNELEGAVQAKGNDNKDIGLYYLGLYAWTKNQVEQAKQWWGQLERVESKAQEQLSPWASMAQEKLRAIDSKKNVA